MSQLHQITFNRASGRWQLAGRGVHTLTATAHDRLLCLREGRLWLTADAQGLGLPPRDCWLQAGDSMRLPAGTAWLAGAEPQASWVLLEAPVAAQGFLARAAALTGLDAWARKAAAIARRAQGAISAADSRASAGTVQ
jgi:Protein of unknown function (DUF2917)